MLTVTAASTALAQLGTSYCTPAPNSDRCDSVDGWHWQHAGDVEQPGC
ncbi:MAG: hypothetical protein R3F49_24990 [Planctomycetota bacterium]